MTTKFQRANIKTMLDSGFLKVRALSFDEIQKLILLARKTGWYGNSELLKYVVDNGTSLENGRIDYDKIDIFLTFQIARSIWVTTLRTFAQYVNDLLNLLDTSLVNESTAKPYKFADLISPGLLFMIQRDMANINVEKYSRHLIDYIFSEVNIRGKLYSGKQKKRYVNEHFEELCNFLLLKNYIDIKTSQIPDSLFPRVYEKFYVALKIAETLDWYQYFEILYNYNTIVQFLNLNSNKLGGVDTTKSVLITGIPGFFQVLRFPISPPIQVFGALLNDIVTKNLNRFSKYAQKQLKKYFRQAIQQVPSEIIEKKDAAEIAIEILNKFALLLKPNKKFLNKIYYIYFDQFSNALSSYINSQYKETENGLRYSNIPDCYILVEGTTEHLCYTHFLNILASKENHIRVIDCQGKDGVYKKYRDLIKNESYIGSVVTVLDSDAVSENSKILKFNPGQVLLKNYIYENGTLEDLFTIDQHIKVISDIYPDGEPIKSEDLSGETNMEAKLSKVIWLKKKSEFNKIKHTNTLLKHIKSEKNIPSVCLDIVKNAIALSDSCYQKKPKFHTLYSLDKLTRDMNRLIKKNLDRV